MKPGSNINVIKKMLKKAREKQKTARIDFDNQRYDDSVSRAYYGVYHSISAALLSKGLHFSSHGQAIGAFNREFIKTNIFPASFTKMIEKLFNERQTGDYDFESYIDDNIAQEDLEHADNILNACEEYLARIYKVDNSYWKE